MGGWGNLVLLDSCGGGGEATVLGSRSAGGGRGLMVLSTCREGVQIDTPKLGKGGCDPVTGELREGDLAILGSHGGGGGV